MKKIEIVIDNEGNVKVEAKNFQGNSCLDATKEFLESLKGKQKLKMKDKNKRKKVLIHG